MRQNSRRYELHSEQKFHEIRNMTTAFGSAAAKRYGERDLIDPALLQAALFYRHDRRQRIRRATDLPRE